MTSAADLRAAPLLLRQGGRRTGGTRAVRHLQGPDRLRREGPHHPPAIAKAVYGSSGACAYAWPRPIEPDLVTQDLLISVM
jgi:hypothetical protein